VLGNDAISIHEQNLSGAADYHVASVCQKEGRTLVTHDKDFADISTYPPDQFPGLIVLQINRQDKSYVLSILEQIVSLISAETLECHLWIVEETYFKLRKQVKDLEMRVAPRARWPISLDTPKSEWVGIFGLSIPETINELPEIGENLPEVKIDYWEYGEVVEILHIGSYSEEEPTIEKLYKFIADSGYEISGVHEEKYLKGPGMFGKGNPKKYKTIIRYPVEKKQMDF